MPRESARQSPSRRLNISQHPASDDPTAAGGSTGTSSGPADRNPFVQWIQGIFGGTTTERPVVLQPPAHCDACTCGQLNKKNRIVGGQETEINQYPWMALMLYSGRFYCGATLINDRYVLTAAHCVNGFSADRITVRLLEHDRSTTTEAQSFERGVERVVKHAGYNSATYNNDIALVRLDKPVDFTGGALRPVCMPTPGKSFTGLEGVVTGWGAVHEHGSIATSLQEVKVPIMSNSECRKSGYGASRITDNMICAGVKKGGRDACQGDSGGPLHVNNGTHQIVGVVSWGEGCAKPNYPGVYTRVNRYGTWIRSNTKDACYC